MAWILESIVDKEIKHYPSYCVSVASKFENSDYNRGSEIAADPVLFEGDTIEIENTTSTESFPKPYTASFRDVSGIGEFVQTVVQKVTDEQFNESGVVKVLFKYPEDFFVFAHAMYNDKCPDKKYEFDSDFKSEIMSLASDSTIFFSSLKDLYAKLESDLKLFLYPSESDWQPDPMEYTHNGESDLPVANWREYNLEFNEDSTSKRITLVSTEGNEDTPVLDADVEAYYARGVKDRSKSYFYTVDYFDYWDYYTDLIYREQNSIARFEYDGKILIRTPASILGYSKSSEYLRYGSELLREEIVTTLLKNFGTGVRLLHVGSINIYLESSKPIPDERRKFKVCTSGIEYVFEAKELDVVCIDD